MLLYSTRTNLTRPKNKFKILLCGFDYANDQYIRNEVDIAFAAIPST